MYIMICSLKKKLYARKETQKRMECGRIIWKGSHFSDMFLSIFIVPDVARSGLALKIKLKILTAEVLNN